MATVNGNPSGGFQVGWTPIYVPATNLSATGSPDTFTTWAPTNAFTLSAGQQEIHLWFATGGCDIDYFEIY